MSVVALYPREASLNITGVHANKHPMTKQIWKFFPLKQTSCDFFLSVVTNFQYPISTPSGHLSFHAMHDSGYCSCRVSMKSFIHSHLSTLRQCFLSSAPSPDSSGSRPEHDFDSFTCCRLKASHQTFPVVQGLHSHIPPQEFHLCQSLQHVLSIWSTQYQRLHCWT